VTLLMFLMQFLSFVIYYLQSCSSLHEPRLGLESRLESVFSSTQTQTGTLVERT